MDCISSEVTHSNTAVAARTICSDLQTFGAEELRKLCLALPDRTQIAVKFLVSATKENDPNNKRIYHAATAHLETRHNKKGQHQVTMTATIAAYSAGTYQVQAVKPALDTVHSSAASSSELVPVHGESESNPVTLRRYPCWIGGDQTYIESQKKTAPAATSVFLEIAEIFRRSQGILLPVDQRFDHSELCVMVQLPSGAVERVLATRGFDLSAEWGARYQQLFGEAHGKQYATTSVLGPEAKWLKEEFEQLKRAAQGTARPEGVLETAKELGRQTLKGTVTGKDAALQKKPLLQITEL